jgi:hypothetical protein
MPRGVTVRLCSVGSKEVEAVSSELTWYCVEICHDS